MINYKNIEFQLYGYLVQLQEMFKTNGIGNEQTDVIGENINLIQSRKFNVAVMGEFKRGKSSLINAMLGLKILPADVTPATATINRITYGSEPSLTILYKDGSTEAADMGNISDYVTMLTEEGLKRASQIKEAVICYPTVICQNHVDIIDTPGLNDNIDMTRVTMGMLKDIDAAIVVVSALAPFSEKETEFVCELIKNDNIENILFVVTYIDQIDEDERDKLLKFIHDRIKKNVSDILRNLGNSEEIMQKARRILDNSLIFGVSSMLALKSFISGDRKLLKESRFEEFKTNLYELLTSQQGMNTIIKAVKGVRSASEEFQRLCDEKINVLTRDILSMDEAAAKLYSYLKTYKDKFRSIFQECRNPIGATLNNVLRLEELLFKSVRACIVSNQGLGVEQNIHALSREAEECKLLADVRVSDELGRQLMTILTDAFERYSAFRNAELIKPMGELNRVCGINLEPSKLFSENITEQLVKIKTPKFSWVVSPIPNAMLFNLYPLADNAQYAVYCSIQRLYGEWMEFVNKIEKWWGMELDSEASAAGFDKLINEIREKKQNELYLFKNTYNQQKSVLENIILKTDEIYNQILFEGNADAV